MLDARLVSAAIASREAYETVSPHIKDTDLTPAGGFWWKLIGEWYARDNLARSVDLSSITALADSRITNPKHRETLLGFGSSLPEPISPANTAQVALELKRFNVGMELAAAIAAQDGKKVAKLHVTYGELLAATSLGSGIRKRTDWTQAVAIDDLFKKVGHENRIPLAPDRLNSRIDGGALPGHHIVIFGRPEMGKSTVSINAAVVMAVRGQRVLYVGNEDQIDVLKARAVCRATNRTWSEAEADQAGTIDLYRKRGAEERLLFVQMSGGGPDALRGQIEEFRPTVLVVDQIRNLEGSGDGLVQKLEENGIAVRKLLLEYGLIGISVTQAGASAEGSPWLGMEDIDSSKTGLPATADLIIGVGANTEMLTRNQRGLSFCKNKLSSASGAREGLIVDIDTSRSKVQ